MVRLVGIFAILLFTLSCNDEVQIKRLYTYPDSSQISAFKNKDQYPELYISLVANLADQIYPETEQRSENSPAMMPATLKVGGLSYLSSYLTTLRNKVEKESNIELLTIATGNTIPSKGQDPKKLEIITHSLSRLNIDLIQMGYNESQWAQAIQSKNTNEKSRDLPHWINSNIFSIKTGRPLENAGTLPFSIKSVGSTFIGLMAITSFDSLSKGQKKDINGIYYQDPLTAILRTKNLLKSKNVNLNILVYQGKLNCSESLQENPLAFDKLESNDCFKDKELELNLLLSKLPPNTIDLIITPSANISSATLKGTPILGLPKSNHFLSMAKLVIDDKEHKIIQKESYVLPPLKICHSVFAGLEDCVLNAPTEDMNEKRFEYLENTAFGLIPSKFLGNQISADEYIESIINGK